MEPGIASATRFDPIRWSDEPGNRHSRTVGAKRPAACLRNRQKGIAPGSVGFAGFNYPRIGIVPGGLASNGALRDRRGLARPGIRGGEVAGLSKPIGPGPGVTSDHRRTWQKVVRDETMGFCRSRWSPARSLRQSDVEGGPDRRIGAWPSSGTPSAPGGASTPRSSSPWPTRPARPGATSARPRRARARVEQEGGGSGEIGPAIAVPITHRRREHAGPGEVGGRRVERPAAKAGQDVQARGGTHDRLGRFASEVTRLQRGYRCAS
jgi:hypothetical protein